MYSCRVGFSPRAGGPPVALDAMHPGADVVFTVFSTSPASLREEDFDFEAEVFAFDSVWHWRPACRQTGLPAGGVLQGGLSARAPVLCGTGGLPASGVL